MHLLYTLCIFCDVLLIVIHALLCVWCFGCLAFLRLYRWIYCASLPFRRRWSIHPCEHLGARDRSGNSKCLAQGVWRIYILARRMKQTCFEKVEHEETKSLLCKWFFLRCLLNAWILADFVLNFRWVVQLLKDCRMLQTGTMYLIFNFVMFYWLWSTNFCAFGALVALHFYVCRDGYTVHPCLFAEDGAFILASTLVPEEDLGTHSAGLSPAWRSAFVLGASTCRDMFWNMSFGAEIRNIF